jgi:hypothetical protein
MVGGQPSRGGSPVYYQAQYGVKENRWHGPARMTGEEAAQDHCDYVNGKPPAATLTSHGHTRQRPKRKIPRTSAEKQALAVLRVEAAKRKVEQANYIYLVGMEDNPSYVKIGEAFDPEDRYIGGQTFNPYTLVLLGFFQTKITRDADKVLHREFAKYHHKAEWFIPADAILKKFGVTREEFLRRCGGKTNSKEVVAA